MLGVSRTAAARCALLAGATATALSGCTDQSGASAGPEPSASTAPAPAPSPFASASESPSQSSTVTLPEPTPPPVPPARRGPAGQRAFAEYVVAAWAYSLAANDARLLVDASAGGRPCLGCKPLLVELGQRRQQGWVVYPFDVRTGSVRLRGSRGDVVARVAVDIPATRSYFSDGSFRNDSPAHHHSVFEVGMRRTGARYQLVGFSVAPRPPKPTQR